MRRRRGEPALPLRAGGRHGARRTGRGARLRTLHQAAARWIGALIRMTSPHPAMTAALDVIGRLQERPYRTNFVLLGEPGTGKAGLARALHQLVCPEGPLVRFNVAGFTDDDALAVLAGDGKRVARPLRRPGARCSSAKRRASVRARRRR